MEPLSKKVAWILLALLPLFISACSHNERADPRVEQAWKHNSEIFEAALRGHQVDDQFDQACAFFEDLTGIQIRANISTVGLLPTDETDKDYALIQEWYKKNHDRLYWDEKSQKVKVYPSKQP